MRKNEINMRMCIVCRARKNKEDLIRIIRIENDLQIDREKNIQSRGVYICNDFECVRKAEKTKVFNRCFKMDAGKEIYERLGEIIVVD